ncbi:transporter substrate-binding domain-containing protein [Oscillatoria sp. CS-180]|uniref:transporter substrate-binding domain-containing protein n=1 Tax=Oscillatoria sp. CS-180 TaxID=3021720 RepID=UPI0023303EB6|nr:transporter substrate-binding domain-containing protein [Oscillatoria sp. CS-180]MDB9524699.1 transporter substrate-binding domain-containing protein [Oscillatoria sp. CS-180]
MVNVVFRSLIQKLGLRAARGKAIAALVLSGLFAIGIVACSGGSITSQDVAGSDVANAQTEVPEGEVSVAGGTLDSVLSAGAIKIAVPQDSPPFGSVGTDGDPQGYDVDVAQLIAEDLEVDLELIPVTSTNRIPYLQTGRADLVISSLGATPERAKSIYFSSTPYAPFFSGIYGPTDANVSSYGDLSGYTIGVTQGALEDLEVSEKAPEGVEIKRFEDNSVTISALLANQVDLIATGNTIAAKVIQDNPDASIENKFVMKNSPCYIGVRRGDLDMLEWVNVFIRHKRFSGDFERLSQEWFGEPLQVPSF